MSSCFFELLPVDDGSVHPRFGRVFAGDHVGKLRRCTNAYILIATLCYLIVKCKTNIDPCFQWVHVVVLYCVAGIILVLLLLLIAIIGVPQH